MRSYLLFLLVFISIHGLFGQQSSKISRYTESTRTSWGVPGMAVGIIKDGEIVLSEGFGQKKSGSDDLVDGDTQFAIASNTKAFIASALATLVAADKIQWDDKVIDYLPYFKLYDPYVTQNTTIRDLLCHRVGLGTFSGDVIWYKSQLSAEEVIKKIQHLPPAYDFRAGYGYSNLMFITAGEVIQKVTGQPWHEYIQESFFEPLEMTNTITSIRDLGSNAATPHKTDDKGNQPIPWVNWDNMGAAGGIISSVNDMLKWIEMNLNNGVWKNDELLDSEQQNLLWTPHNSFPISAGSRQEIPGRHFTGYGLGWGLYDYYGNLIVTHSGGYDGMYSRVLMVPDQQLGIVVLTNSMSGISLPLCLYVVNQYIKKDMRDWSEVFLTNVGDGEDRIGQLKAARRKGTQPSLALTSYHGSYDAPLHGEIKIVHQGQQLRLEFSNAPDLNANLEHWHGDTWQIVWDQTHAWFDFGLVTFQLNNLQQVTGLSFDVPNNDIFFDELKVKRVPVD